MYNYSGITYRLWGECGIIALLGIVCLVIAFISSKPESLKRNSVIGIVALVTAVLSSLEYVSSIKNPDIQVFEGTYSEGYRDSRVAPPLPFTWKYRFVDTEGTNGNYYIDTFTKKEIFNEDLIKGERYRIYYEADTQIIVKIEPIE